MALATVAAGIGIATGVNALTGGAITDALGLGGGSVGSGGGSTTGQQAQTAADPFAKYRGGLAAQYNAALQPGATTDITKLPGYSQFQSGVMDPALTAVKSSAVSSGQGMSGAENISLTKTAEQGYYGFMTDYMNRLATGSGASNNPLGAASLGVTQGNANQAGVMQGLGAVSTGISSLAGQFGNGSTANGYLSTIGATGNGPGGNTAANQMGSDYAASLGLG